MTLADAREQAIDARRLLRQGIDPSLQRKRAKESRTAELEDRFKPVAEEWLGNQSRIWSKSHLDKIRGRLELHVFPYIGREAVVDLTAPTLLKVFRRIESKGTHETAHRAMNACNRIMRYAIATGRCKTNPVTDLQGALMPVGERHLPAITDPKELGVLLRSFAGYEGSPITKAALELAPHLFVRPGELRQARWSEFDFDRCEWLIPKETMKMGEEHVVPLSDQVIRMLGELHQLTGDREFCFPGARTAKRPMSNNTVNAALRRLGYAKGQVTGHGFRTTASTFQNELGWNRDFVERQLAHRERNKSRGAYNRAEYLAGRHQMMQAWSNHLDELKDKPLTARRSATEYFLSQRLKMGADNTSTVRFGVPAKRKNVVAPLRIRGGISGSS